MVELIHLAGSNHRFRMSVVFMCMLCTQKDHVHMIYFSYYSMCVYVHQDVIHIKYAPLI
jgi:hypothetical protein